MKNNELNFYSKHIFLYTTILSNISAYNLHSLLYIFVVKKILIVQLQVSTHGGWAWHVRTFKLFWSGKLSNQIEINTILNAHNDARSIVSPTAAKMASVVWDSRLARIAQSRSDQCIFAHDCNGCRKMLNYPNYDIGQNAYWSYGSFDWVSAIGAFISEKQYFTYGGPQNGTGLKFNFLIF